MCICEGHESMVFLSVAVPLLSPPVGVVSPPHHPLLVPSPLHIVSYPFHPQSTPRAVAHEAGGGWCVICCHRRHLPLSITVPLRIVLCWYHLPSASSPTHSTHSTHDPPHEQLLVRLEGGGVLFVVIIVVSPSLSSFPSHHSLLVSSPFSVVSYPCFCHCCSTCNPPHEQWLMRLGAGGASLGVGPVCVISYR